MGSSLTAFTWDAVHGVLHPFETLKTTPKDYTGYNDCAELYFRPDGKFLYRLNRGHDSITVFAIDPVKGTPTPVQYVHTEGKTPRSFGIDPTGSYLIAANQDSDSPGGLPDRPEQRPPDPHGAERGRNWLANLCGV